MRHVFHTQGEPNGPSSMYASSSGSSQPMDQADKSSGQEYCVEIKTKDFDRVDGHRVPKTYSKTIQEGLKN
jgi:hypothetical protein